ncbi:MAG: orotidine 5'-phosphate decarboxylase [Bacteroidetes bacterium GWF2_42_66]|nr:MAG: orotidine 5'-phosphate decarboxylase [Bacteroidetes bacterium GWA2_42_15]OFX96597.1 MAG: orotidine 5'-phosphate decarboxylase [Bacteroidetes bacterium GWE2_42_39]OFY45322.1 MAG: orotidine 5'-phosphate decarboxylase [Bacteroidetes bacterium GWF2_42_66]HAZ02176.1 orotidine-5'-phosphate decarboxylase [Marinilabiliales bacterium]HBL78412.1 orotidine-5'-phosphate decarboxylase [Prolixibacteraceae bacterium]
MNREQLFNQIKKKRSFLCVGLDTDILKIPAFLKDTSDPLFAFNKEIIDATHDLCVAYKPNLAFYESLGVKGWEALEKTVNYIRQVDPEIFIIADAKRGDIGNTSNLYARAFFDHMDFDAVTVAPYMGEDSVKPFMTYHDKWVILLALTSNKGAFDFQFLKDEKSGDLLFESVLKTSQNWGDTNNMMYVVGATKAEKLEDIRTIVPDHFLLVPGVGAQGGSLEEVAKYGMNDHCGLLVNSSRQIIYASDGEDFAGKARNEALNVQVDMEELLLEAELL